MRRRALRLIDDEFIVRRDAAAVGRRAQRHPRHVRDAHVRTRANDVPTSITIRVVALVDDDGAV